MESGLLSSSQQTVFDQTFPRKPIFRAKLGYDLAAAFYDKWTWQEIWTAVEWPHLQRYLRRVQFQRGQDASLLDIGTGTGLNLNRISDTFGFRRIVGIDTSEKMLARARWKLGRAAELKCGDATDLEFPQQSFDVITLLRVSSHIQDLNTIAKEINRVLTPGGYLILSDIDPLHIYESTRIPVRQGKILIETYKHSANEWERAAAECGLKKIGQRSISTSEIRRAKVRRIPSSVSDEITRPVSYLLFFQKRYHS